MKTNLLSVLLTAAALAAPATVHAGDDSRDASGDPARWSQPIETPRQRYENTLKEARNALADAIKECRANAAGRKTCEADARAQHERDVRDARKFLETPSSGVKR